MYTKRITYVTIHHVIYKLYIHIVLSIQACICRMYPPAGDPVVSLMLSIYGVRLSSNVKSSDVSRRFEPSYKPTA